MNLIAESVSRKANEIGPWIQTISCRKLWNTKVNLKDTLFSQWNYPWPNDIADSLEYFPWSWKDLHVEGQRNLFTQDQAVPIIQEKYLSKEMLQYLAKNTKWLLPSVIVTYEDESERKDFVNDRLWDWKLMSQWVYSWVNPKLYMNQHLLELNSKELLPLYLPKHPPNTSEPYSVDELEIQNIPLPTILKLTWIGSWGYSVYVIENTTDLQKFFGEMKTLQKLCTDKHLEMPNIIIQEYIWNLKQENSLQFQWSKNNELSFTLKTDNISVNWKYQWTLIDLSTWYKLNSWEKQLINDLNNGVQWMNFLWSGSLDYLETNNWKLYWIDLNERASAVDWWRKVLTQKEKEWHAFITWYSSQFNSNNELLDHFNSLNLWNNVILWVWVSDKYDSSDTVEWYLMITFNSQQEFDILYNRLCSTWIFPKCKDYLLQ
jgi:hypothetical protein